MRFAVLCVALAGVLACFREGASRSASPQTGVPGDAAAKHVIEEQGTGTCSTDEDCVLSDYLPGCCKQACEPNAFNRDDIAAAIAQERTNCEAFRGRELCPPPDECAPSTRTVLSAKCVKATCYRVVEL